MEKIITRFGMIFFISLLFISPVSGAEPITFYWIDLGIRNWIDEMKLGADFKNLSLQHRETVIVQENPGQILVPMPGDREMPETDEEWVHLSSEIYAALSARIEEALESGISTIEIRTVQNINLKGYFAPWRQAKVIKFINMFALALEKLKETLLSERDVTVNGIWGSNGGYAASVVVPLMGTGLVDKGLLVDARAWESDVRNLYKALNGNLAIINTSGDAPARYYKKPTPVARLNERMVAHHDTAKSLKHELPELKLYWVMCDDFQLPQHLASLRWKRPVKAKEFTGDGYAELKNMTGAMILAEVFGSTTTDEEKEAENSGQKSYYSQEKDAAYFSYQESTTTTTLDDGHEDRDKYDFRRESGQAPLSFGKKFKPKTPFFGHNRKAPGDDKAHTTASPQVKSRKVKQKRYPKPRVPSPVLTGADVRIQAPVVRHKRKPLKDAGIPERPSRQGKSREPQLRKSPGPQVPPAFAVDTIHDIQRRQKGIAADRQRQLIVEQQRRESTRRLRQMQADIERQQRELIAEQQRRESTRRLEQMQAEIKLRQQELSSEQARRYSREKLQEIQNHIKQQQREITNLPAKQELGGVDISPEPRGQKADLRELKQNILKRRPSDEVLSWPAASPLTE